MPRSREELNAGEWAVLGLIDEQPTYGFAVARAVAPSGELGRVWSLRRPLVYARSTRCSSAAWRARPARRAARPGRSAT